MKRIYTKPELFCEEYELSVAIAGNCGQKFSKITNSTQPSTCSFPMGTSNIFLDTNTRCDTYNYFDYDLFCYEGSHSGEKIIFGS